MPRLAADKRVRIGVPILTILLLLSLLRTSPLAGQDSVAVSATLLRALAEAADGFRTDRDVYLVADYRFPHNIAGSFASRPAAEKVRADSGAYFGVFGPYRTAKDPGSDSATRVIGIRLLTENAQGQRRSIVVDPKVVDALFFSPSAVDKFVVPYYTRIYGPQYGVLVQAAEPRVYIKCHALSHDCYVGQDGIVMLPDWDPKWGVPVPGKLPGPPPR
jgi:hypothetical protein